MKELSHIIGPICVALALLLDISSYWRQIAKIKREKKSNNVSAMSYLYKIAKAGFAILALAIYCNWVGMGMEILLLVVYTVSFIVIVKYKPKKWKLFNN